jgi:Protein of unknown function (DUF3006)
MPSYTIDRFEGIGWAVLEDEHGQTFTVPRDWLPSAAREGDALKGDAAAQTTAATMIRFELDPTGRDEQLAKARARRDALPRGPKGDISL